MPLLEKRTPWREFDLMDRRTRRFFEELGVVPALAPAADVFEADGELVVELEVPGFDDKELEIQVSDHVLSIAGERLEETEQKKRSLHLHERLEKKFERRFELPVDVDTEHIKAEYLKGVLTVHVPKTGTAKARTIEIEKP